MGMFIIRNTGTEMDDEEDEPCDMLTLQDDHECPLCQYNQSDASVIDRMNQMEQNMTGTTSSEEIYRTLASLYDIQVRQPLLNQGLAAPEITVCQIRSHYTLHKLNLRDIVSKEILAVNNMQIHNNIALHEYGTSPFEVFKLVLERSDFEEINHSNGSFTLVHFVLQHIDVGDNKLKAVAMINDSRIDLSIKDFTGRTALDIALEKRLHEIVRLIRKNMFLCI